MCYSPNRNLLVDALVGFVSPEAFWLPIRLSFRAQVFLPIVPCHITTKTGRVRFPRILTKSVNQFHHFVARSPPVFHIGRKRHQSPEGSGITAMVTNSSTNRNTRCTDFSWPGSLLQTPIALFGSRDICFAVAHIRHVLPGFFLGGSDNERQFLRTFNKIREEAK